MKNQKHKIFISHNQFCHACPTAISEKGNEVYFNFDKLSKELKEKLYGRIEVVQLTIDEMKQINEASHAIKQVGAQMLRNIFTI